MSCRARKGWLPRERTNSSSAGRGSPSRLVRAVAVVLIGLRSGARVQLGCAEKESNLARRRIGRIGAVHHVALDALGEVGADRAGRGLLRIGGTHDVAVAGHGILALEHLNHDGTGAHVAHQIGKERALAMHRVEGLCLALRQLQHARADDSEACLLEAPVHLADEICADAVGLHYRQGALERHCVHLPKTRRQREKAPAASVRPAGKRGSLHGVPHTRQSRARRKCRFGKGFLDVRRGSRGGAALNAQTEKLSPQPHSPFTLGFLKRKASLRPCFTKSTTVPSINVRLAASTNTCTPRSSNTISPACGPSA